MTLEIKNLCEQIPYQRKRHMAESHTLLYDVFIYIYIYIDFQKKQKKKISRNTVTGLAYQTCCGNIDGTSTFFFFNKLIMTSKPYLYCGYTHFFFFFVTVFDIR